MRIEEYNELFDDEHQVHFKAVDELVHEEKQQQPESIFGQTWEEQRKILGFE